MLQNRGNSTRGMFSIEGMVLFAAVGLSWYLYVIWRYPDVLGDWIGVEIVGRLQYDAHHRLSSEAHKVLTNYIPIMIFGTGPWLLWLLYKFRRSLCREKLRALLADSTSGVEHWFLLIAIAAQFALFSFSASRMPLYLVPLFVPMAIAVGRGLEHLLENGKISRSGIVRVACATALVMAIAKGASAYQGTWKNMTDIAMSLQAVPEVREGTQVTALFRSPLNGLQFHLDRRIPTIYFEIENPELLKQAATRDFPLPTVVGIANTDLLPVGTDDKPFVPAKSLVIVRSKDLAAFGPFFEPFGLKIVTKSNHWTLLSVNVPIVVSETKAAEPIEDHS